MRYIRYAVLAVLAFGLISVCLANRAVVDIKLLPEAFAELAGMNPAISLPLFVIVLGGVGVGLAIGYVMEYLREHKHRREARVQRGEARKLSREVKKLKKQKNEGKDEVLALLEDAT